MTIDLPKYTFGKEGTVTGFKDKNKQPVPKYSKIRSFYDYTLPMMIFAGFGFLAIIFALLLKREDRKKGYGLELPNIKKQ